MPSVPRSLAAALIALSIAVPAAGGAGDKGREVFAARDAQDSGFGAQSVVMDMTLTEPGGRTSTRRISVRQLEGPRGAGDKAVIVFDYPNDIRGTALLTHEALGRRDDSQWLYLPAYSRTKRIASGDRSGRFAGTEFSYEDLTGDKFEDFTYRYLGADQISGRTYYRIERVPLTPNSEYSRQITWVDPSNNQVVVAHLFDRRGRHIKTYEASDWRLYRSRFWRPHLVRMTHVPSGRTTVMRASRYNIGIRLSGRDFDPAMLRRASQ